MVEKPENTTCSCMYCNKEHRQEYNRYFCSKECMDKWDARYDWQQSNAKESDDGVICPYCGYEHSANGNYSELYDEYISWFECSNCHKNFEVEAQCSWSWTSKPLVNSYTESEDDNNEQI